MDQQEFKANIKRSESWLRGLFVLFFALIFQIVEVVIIAITVFQFASTIITRQRFTSLDQFSQGLAQYTKNLILYLTYQTEQKPFPFRDWKEETLDSK